MQQSSYCSCRSSLRARRVLVSAFATESPSNTSTAKALNILVGCVISRELYRMFDLCKKSSYANHVRNIHPQTIKFRITKLNNTNKNKQQSLQQIHLVKYKQTVIPINSKTSQRIGSATGCIKWSSEKYNKAATLH